MQGARGEAPWNPPLGFQRTWGLVAAKWPLLGTNATVGPLQGLLVNTCSPTRAWDHPVPDPHGPFWRKGYPSALRQPLAPQQEGWSSQWCPWARALHRAPGAGQRLRARQLLWEGSQGGGSRHGALGGLQFHGSPNQVKSHIWTVWAQVVTTPSGPPHRGGVGGAMDQEVAHPSVSLPRRPVPVVTGPARGYEALTQKDAFPGGPEAEAALKQRRLRARPPPQEQPAGPGAQDTLTVTPRGKGTLEARDRRARPPRGHADGPAPPITPLAHMQLPLLFL